LDTQAKTLRSAAYSIVNQPEMTDSLIQSPQRVQPFRVQAMLCANSR
jgi:hypothetical protein